MNKKLEQKFREVYENTLENVDLKYTGNLKNLDYFGLFCKATAQDKLYKFLGLNTCMFNYIHEKQDSVMIIFSIPINSQDSGAKNVAERVMEVIGGVEDCFVTLDHVKSEEVKEDKFVYVTAIKKIK